MFKKSLSKIDLIKNLSNKTGFSINYSKKIINDFVEILLRNIKDNDFILKNIGSFKIIKKKERIGRNPKTMQEFTISSRKSVKFIPSKKIKNDTNKLL